MSKSVELFYSVAGHGPKTLLLFHGFGQDHTVFNQLVLRYQHLYTCYSFDLYFHGSTQWSHDEEPLEKQEWASQLNDFLERHTITDFSVLGYSMGGKFALATLEAFPNRVKELFLLAPDGVTISNWYKVATYPFILRKLFKSMILHPDRFQLIVNFAKSVGLIDKMVKRFVENQMNTEEKRKQVYYSWVVFRHLRFRMSHIATIINTNQIKTRLVVGRYDKVIAAEKMKPLAEKLTQNSLEIPECGHNDVINSFGF